MTTKTKKVRSKRTTRKTTRTTARSATARKGAARPAQKPARESRWGLARELIKAGKTNAEVLAALRDRFKLPEEHSYYPSWYRTYAVKNGVVTREFARAHAGPPVARKLA